MTIAGVSILVWMAFAFWIFAWWLNQRLVAIDTGHNLALTRVIGLAVP